MKLKFSLTRSAEDRISTIAILYFMIGLIFALYYALYFHWDWIAFFSPNFFFVVFSWPFQAVGFIGNIIQYGPFGKPI